MMKTAHGVIPQILLFGFAAVLTFGCGSKTGPRPEILSFGSDPSTIIFGETSRLTWSVSNAKSISISPGVGTVTGSSTMVSPAATTNYTLTATGSGGSAAATAVVTVKTVADILSYTDPVSGHYRLVKNAAKSSDSHLVLDLVGPSGSVSGVGFYLSADRNRVLWTVVDPGDTEGVQNTVFSNALVKSRVIGNTLEAGIYQKGAIAPVSATTTTVLASVALDLRSGVLIRNPPTVNLAPVSGKAVILNPPGSAAPATSIDIAAGTLTAR